MLGIIDPSKRQFDERVCLHYVLKNDIAPSGFAVREQEETKGIIIYLFLLIKLL